ncbi:DUF354 domain-containing protein [Spirosoma harenae]
MKFLFYFGHPAQYLSARETIKRLSKKKGNQVIILIKTKDVLEDLIKKDGIEYTNILPKERGSTKLAILLSLFHRILIILPILLKKRPDLLIGTDAALAQLGKILSINRVTIIEDDYPIVKHLADLTYPFTQTILCPEVCDVGGWESKKVGYEGYMKLGYLHPSVFTHDNTIKEKYFMSKKYALIRLSRLAAHHDIGIQGINENLLNEIIQRVRENGYDVWISAEGKLTEKYRCYCLNIDPTDMHHILASASLLVSDSQSMSVEASMLGVPSLRYSSFVGKISVLNELENRYGLTFGIQLGEKEKLLLKIDELLTNKELYATFQQKRRKMLDEKIDSTTFWVWFLENYPVSKKYMIDKKATQYSSKYAHVNYRKN